jgi:hypothetical protein
MKHAQPQILDRVEQAATSDEFAEDAADRPGPAIGPGASPETPR